jgi:cytochrome oxidase Cu insertion factor (SCO1/SenC/PrrC family)
MSSPWSQSALVLALVGLAAAWSSMVGPATVAAAEENPQPVAEGKPAPQINLPATQIGLVLPEERNAKTLHLKDLQGKKNVVLYFFPKALTKG